MEERKILAERASGAATCQLTHGRKSVEASRRKNGGGQTCLWSHEKDEVSSKGETKEGERSDRHVVEKVERQIEEELVAAENGRRGMETVEG